jgi:hypothetical protein
MHGSSFLRRLTAWAMLAVYGLVASGLPLPVAIPAATGTAAARTLAGKDRSQPFPCMDKACGCDSAERCFSNCCCHTPAETLAWARARRIEPAVLAALAHRVAAAKPAPQARGCCPAEAATPACCAAAKPAAASCCTADQPAAPIDDRLCGDYQSLAAERADGEAGEADPPLDEPAPRGVVILRAMLACGGIVAQWAAASVSLPPPEVVTCELAWPAIGTIARFNERALGTGSPPDLPPPRA